MGKNRITMYRISLYLFLLLMSCRPQDRVDFKDQNCPEAKQMNALIKAAIDIPKLQPFLEIQSTIRQDQLVIVKNGDVTEDSGIIKFNRPVLFLTSEQISNDRIKAFIEFKDIKIHGDSAHVYLRYDVQGIGCKSAFRRVGNCNWDIVYTTLWEN